LLLLGPLPFLLSDASGGDKKGRRPILFSVIFISNKFSG
jgi:hypothetical protein